MVVAALVKRDVQQRSTHERLVEFHVAVCNEPGADGVTGERGDKDRSDAERSSPEAVPRSQQPPDYQADRNPVQDHRGRDACLFGRERRSLQKRVQRQA